MAAVTLCIKVVMRGELDRQAAGHAHRSVPRPPPDESLAKRCGTSTVRTLYISFFCKSSMKHFIQNKVKSRVIEFIMKPNFHKVLCKK
jgi:hypothetical protein